MRNGLDYFHDRGSKAWKGCQKIEIRRRKSNFNFETTTDLLKKNNIFWGFDNPSVIPEVLKEFE